MKNKLLFSVFVYFIILTLLSLGFWQIYRLNWKLELIEQIENSLKNDPVEFTSIEKKNYLRIKTSGEIDFDKQIYLYNLNDVCLLYTSPSPRDRTRSRMPSSA